MALQVAVQVFEIPFCIAVLGGRWCDERSRPYRAGEIPAAEGPATHGEASLGPVTREGID